jgi:hypothetical protein
VVVAGVGDVRGISRVEVLASPAQGGQRRLQLRGLGRAGARVGTLVSVAVGPAGPGLVRTATGPARVSKCSNPGPSRSAIATAAAIVA